MSFKNQRRFLYLCTLHITSNIYMSLEDLYKQFAKEKDLTCVLDYMMRYQDQEKFIFRNYTVIFQHVFEGLHYLEAKGIVHRDIKCKVVCV